MRRTIRKIGSTVKGGGYRIESAIYLLFLMYGANSLLRSPQGKSEISLN